ncbi:lytic transglycosylase domain-containing protein [Solilutibacter pythonis]|nr:lytic transglycosylase domain-containing protein [Lysobacter pythonis]
MELMGCQIEVPASVMHHVVKVESSYNPYAIGVVGGRLVRQPGNLAEAVATAEMLESRGFNFSLGLAQVNRYNLNKYGLASYEAAFQVCPNLSAGARILRECHGRSGGHWGKAFSCYYSGNFTTGYRHGYVQKVEASMLAMRGPETPSLAIPVITRNGGAARVSASRTLSAPNRRSLPAASTAAALMRRRASFDAATPEPAPAAPPAIAQATAGETARAPAVAVPTPATPPPQKIPRMSNNGDSAFVF